jgi:hypothetical protein
LRSLVTLCIVDRNTKRVSPMSVTKTVSMSFRFSPKFKAQLEAAAQRENRSLTNTLEALLDAYCRQNGLQVTVKQNNEVAQGAAVAGTK